MSNLVSAANLEQGSKQRCSEKAFKFYLLLRVDLASYRGMIIFLLIKVQEFEVVSNI